MKTYRKFKEENEDRIIKKLLRELPNERIMEWLEFNWEEVSVEFNDNLERYFKPEIEKILWNKYVEDLKNARSK